MALPANSGPWSLIQFSNHFSQTVGLLGRVICPPQGRYLHTEHKHRINAYTHQTSMPSLSGIRTHDPSDRESEDSSCLRPRGYCDWHRSRYSDWLRAGRPRDCSSSPGGGQEFSLLHVVQTGSGAHLASYPMGTGGSFLGGIAAGA
jgi:hypothetical protein